MSNFVDRIGTPGSHVKREGGFDDPMVQRRIGEAGVVTGGIRQVVRALQNTFPEVIYEDTQVVEQPDPNGRPTLATSVVARSAVQQTMQGQNVAPADAARY